MTDFATSAATPFAVNTHSRYGPMWEARNLVSSSASAATQTWAVANTAFYVPIWLPWSYPVRRMFWENGSAAGGNWDVGIYSSGGVRLYSSGSTAGSGNNAPQFVTPSPLLMLGPGRYYLAAVNSTSTSARAYATSTFAANILRSVGLLQEASALPLPAVMTPAAIGSAFVPWLGITRKPTGMV